MSVYYKVQQAFENELSLIADLPVIVNENDIGEKVQNDLYSSGDTKYIRTSLIPARTDKLCIGIGGSDIFKGIFQIDIFVPSGNSIEESNVWVDEIISHFKGQTLINNGVSVRIDNYSRTPGRFSTNLHQVGVALEWYCITNN